MEKPKSRPLRQRTGLWPPCSLLPRYVDTSGPTILDAAGIQKAVENANKSNQSLVDLGALLGTG